MLKKYLLSSLIILIHFNSFSQSEYVYYFDNNINVVEKSYAAFKGVGSYENGKLELRIFNIKDESLQSIWHFTDSSLQVFNGFFITFFNKKMKNSEGNYLLGKKDGLWRNWDLFGNIIDSSIYNNDEEIMKATFKYYPDRKLMRIIIDSVSQGKQGTIFYDESGNIIKTDLSKITEDTDRIFTKTEISAAFPGGPLIWQRYVTRTIQNHISVLNENDYGTVLVKFIVDKDGKISEAHALTMQGTRIAKVAIDAIMKGPNWIPAQQNGRYVKSYRIQPFAFSDPNH